MFDKPFPLDRRSVLASGAAVAPLPAQVSLGRFYCRPPNVNSDLWLVENIQPQTFAERSGDACDSYHRWADDIALLK